MLDPVGTGRALAALLTSVVKFVQLALWKFHLRTGFSFVDWMSDGVVISDGRCWEQGNLSRMHCTGSGSCPMVLAKAKSGLLSVFQRPEMNEWGSFGSNRSTVSAEEGHSARDSSSWLVVLYPQSVCQQLKLLAYTVGAEASGSEAGYSLLGGGL